MAVDDLWFRKGPDGKRVESAKHGRGKRYRVRYTDPDKKVRSEHFTRKVDADRFDLKVRAELSQGSFIDPLAGRQTFRVYAEAWRTAQPHRPNTAGRVRSQLEHHVYPVLGTRALAAIRPSEVQAFIAGASLTLAPGSVRTLFAVVSSVFAAAMRDRLIGHDPTDGVKVPPVVRSRVVPLTVEQLEALVEAMPDRYRAVAVVGAGTGLRQAELFGLQVRDVDFLRKIVRVERQVQPYGVGPPKNAKAHRSIPVGDVVIGALAEHLRSYPAKGEEFIFTLAGLPLSRDRFNGPVWAKARRAAGLPGVGMHDLRHFYASALIRAGLSVKVVSERLGHSNAAMTLNVYSHLWPDDEDRTRRAIDQVFRVA